MGTLHLLLNCAVNPKLLYNIKYLKKAKMNRVCDTDRDETQITKKALVSRGMKSTETRQTPRWGALGMGRGFK